MHVFCVISGLFKSHEYFIVSYKAEFAFTSRLFFRKHEVNEFGSCLEIE